MFSVPKDLERLVEEIDGWLDLRCPDKALDRLPPLLERPDARPEGLALRVRAYVATKRHREALVDLAELRTTSYEPDWLDLTEAWCQKRLQNLPAAVRCMEQLLARNPRSAIGHFNLGCYLALGGERERALEEVTVACGMDATFRTLLDREPDLDSLRKDPRFRALEQPDGSAHGTEPAAEDEPEEAFDDEEGGDDDTDDGDADEGDERSAN